MSGLKLKDIAKENNERNIQVTLQKYPMLSFLLWLAKLVQGVP